MVNPTAELDNDYTNYIVDKQETSVGEMDLRICPLCDEQVIDPSGQRPTVFLTHLSTNKREHAPLNQLCACNHTRLCHLEEKGSQAKDFGYGPCSFSSCGCTGFRRPK